METYFITITGVKNYYGFKPFTVGKMFKIRKECDNPHDSEAIVAELPFIDTIGYVANSVHTVYDGTVSAGRLYDRIDDYTYATTMFITHSSVIALVSPSGRGRRKGNSSLRKRRRNTTQLTLFSFFTPHIYVKTGSFFGFLFFILLYITTRFLSTQCEGFLLKLSYILATETNWIRAAHNS